MSPPGDRWAVGARHALAFPADPATLRNAGARFLTLAFRASGVLRDNGIARITGFGEVHAGSTGRKAILSVDYATPEPGLPDHLFVKFSRDFDDPIRDRGKTQMESEVRFAALSRAEGFPIAVPAVQFADYDTGTGTGILITERIAFGVNGIERQYHKCLDYELPGPVEHYRALLTALARLAGTHRSGRLPADLVAHFPADVRGATVGERARVSGDALNRRLGQLVDFVHTHPGLVPAAAGAPEFLARLRTDVPRVAAHEAALMHGLAADSDYVALCHWNANIDNAWFWRDADGLRCGLMDWGCVGQMNLGMGIWGALSGAETWLWERHLDELLEVFVTEFVRCGGPQLEPDRLRRHTLLYAAAMGVAWLLDVPALIRHRFDVAPASRMDPRVRGDESVRAPLQMLSNLLSLWHRHRIGDLLDTGS
ncbi:hypothetical protein BN971_00850 [Mycobacterium bohemicum DSM 44277]|uniref:Aminoglycoside phosphotransferase domain-containing protein n=2 Tax=Mycobacterium bohemicum TaxID=56425 RepID=A0A1X1R279_MYCBE|nr:hypothetical protein [Mycobacterium bohemicum]MCV6972133.1 hypothetical protein [Mycobacterium bohemicum]ORU98289.1 hypothetical protein AWB93_15220 [Mycobacterium bohemicum]CPR06759.1 hypothetical protein BN971_00850 [Mycobacterium bohemicum DSM 44277]